MFCESIPSISFITQANQKNLGFKNWMTWKGTSGRHENQKMEENIKCVNTVVPKFFESLSGSQKTLHSLFFRHTSRCSLFKIVLSFSELKNGYSFSCHWNVSNKNYFFSKFEYFTGFPLGQKNLENGKACSSQGKVREFCQSSKVGTMILIQQLWLLRGKNHTWICPYIW